MTPLADTEGKSSASPFLAGKKVIMECTDDERERKSGKMGKNLRVPTVLRIEDIYLTDSSFSLHKF